MGVVPFTFMDNVHHGQSFAWQYNTKQRSQENISTFEATKEPRKIKVYDYKFYNTRTHGNGQEHK
jgi:hypothetical protein